LSTWGLKMRYALFTFCVVMRCVSQASLAVKQSAAMLQDGQMTSQVTATAATAAAISKDYGNKTFGFLKSVYANVSSSVEGLTQGAALAAVPRECTCLAGAHDITAWCLLEKRAVGDWPHGPGHGCHLRY
jgi:hypothetical protein